MKWKKSNIVKAMTLAIYTIFALVISSWILNLDLINVNEWAFVCTWLALLLILVQSLVVKILCVKFFSLEYIFLLLCYVFYLGQTFLIHISYDFGELSFSLAYVTYGAQRYIISTKYSLICIVFVFLGLMLGCFKGCFPSFSKHHSIACRRNGMDRSTAQIMFMISAPFEFYSIGIKLFTILTSTYLDAHGSGGGMLVDLMSSLFFASLIFFLIESFERSSHGRLVFAAIILYEAFTMLTGQRAMAIIKIFICAFVYYQLDKKVNWKSAVKLVVGALILSYVIIIVRNSRAEGFSLQSFNITTNGFILFDLISEFGITGKVVTAAFAKVTEFAGGKSIGCAFLAVIPRWTSLFGGDLMEKYYTYTALNQEAWGSSFVSDFYFDFGFVGGIIASGIYAFLIGKFFLKFRTHLSAKASLSASVYAYFVL